MPQAEDAGDSMLDPLSSETSRQRLCRSLKERVARGEYWVDLDFLACLLVDSGALYSSQEDSENFG